LTSESAFLKRSMTNPETPQPDGDPIDRPARYGLSFFAVYVLLYAGFIFLAVFRTADMGAPVLGGVNLAIAYGLGLIAAAIFLAIVYVFLCRHPAPPPGGGGQD